MIHGCAVRVSPLEKETAVVVYGSQGERGGSIQAPSGIQENEVLEEIFKITEERLEKKFKFKVSLLSEEEIAQRRYEKNNLFICKC